jgi:hypothetical protein
VKKGSFNSNAWLIVIGPCNTPALEEMSEK